MSNKTTLELLNNILKNIQDIKDILDETEEPSKQVELFTDELLVTIEQTEQVINEEHETVTLEELLELREENQKKFDMLIEQHKINDLNKRMKDYIY